MLLTATPAFAQDTGSPAPDLSIPINLLWVVIGAVLVIFMQAGFALVETGFCRAKHAAHVVSTNFAIFGLGFVAYFLVGYTFMFGGYSFAPLGYDKPIGSALIGSGNWVFLWKGDFALSGSGAYTAGVMAFFLYMVAFMDTTATIPTGAMAERWKWNAFVGWGLFCGALYYPLFGAWTWGGGWLASLGKSMHLGFGYTDFAGSGVVHAMGGIAGLAGAVILGPRIGKYGKDGKPRALGPHHIPMAMLGTFILLVRVVRLQRRIDALCGRHPLRSRGDQHRDRRGVRCRHRDVLDDGPYRQARPGDDGERHARRLGRDHRPLRVRAALGGRGASARLAGVFVVEAVWFVERKAKIDDPVGAISVHGVCGIWGVLCVGIFADGQYGQGWNGTAYADTAHGVTGILYGGEGWGQLGAQAVGAVTIIFVMVRLRIRLLQDPERGHEGWHPAHSRGRARRPGHSRDGCARLRVPARSRGLRARARTRDLSSS